MPSPTITCIPNVTLDGVGRILIDNLKDLQAFIKVPIIITSALRPGDPAEHGRGLALDVMVPTYPGALLDLYLAAERFDFSGIGVYPEWRYNGNKIGGLHLDLRAADYGARWLGIKDSKGNNLYLALSSENLRKHGVI